MLSAARKIRLWSFIINNMSSTALISCTMKIDLYLLNGYPLNPSILQTMSFVSSTCLKISKITFCFTTIRWKNEGNIFTSLKDLTSSNAQFSDQNCCSSESMRKLLCLYCCFFVCFFILFMIITCLHVSPWRLINSVI